MLSRSLAEQGRIEEARHRVEQVTTAATESHNKQLELKAGITAARIQAVSTNATDVAESIKHLNKLIADATEASFAGVVLEARLALGETEMNSGNRAEGRSHLELLERDAGKGGFALIARKAAAALGSGQDRASAQNQN